jgi:predicted RNA binding protein YcfA (HicA-like mRNA interferase family)
VNSRQVVRALERAGFEFARQHGSHAILVHPASENVVTVPVHSGRELTPKTLSSILRQAGLTAEEFRELLR